MCVLFCVKSGPICAIGEALLKLEVYTDFVQVTLLSLYLYKINQNLLMMIWLHYDYAGSYCS